VAEQYFGVNSSNPRLHIYNEDGRIFLKQTDQKYDLVILDAYSKSYVPFHLMTTEFFKLLVSHLTPMGSILSNLIAQTAGNGFQLLGAESNTIQAVFPNVYAFATSGPDYPDLQNIIILASLGHNRLTEADFQNLARAPNAAGIQLVSEVGNLFTLGANKEPILTDNFAPVENLLDPMTGQPLNAQEPSPYVQGAERIMALVLIAAVIFVILHRRKML